MKKRFTWARKGGYECSSKGDKRFSAFNAIMKDGRSIEQHYQCDIKGYDIGGTNWKLGKGKPPLPNFTQEQLYELYSTLWVIWAKENMPLMRELYRAGVEHDYILSDMFATTEINQAHALADVLNSLCLF